MTGPLTTAQAEQAAAVKWIEDRTICARCGGIKGGIDEHSCECRGARRWA